MHVFIFAFQTQTKSYNQQASTESTNYCINIMLTAKGTAKKAIIKNKDKNNQLKKDAENSCTKEFEFENDEQELQIDTGNDAKIETSEVDGEQAEKENVQGKVNKRNSDGTDNNPTPTKKARPKPKPQIIENMQEYIDNNTIEKLTTTTLLHWLKERNLHCSTRDKKAELIQKVKNQFISIKT